MNSDPQHLQRELERLFAWCLHLQARGEQHRAVIANQLHDEIGGLLVAARLNVAWLQERLPGADSDIAAHLQRLSDALRHGVEVKRRIVEDLRPTLLDNLGLYSALRWQLARTCEPAQLTYSEQYPDEELALEPGAAIIVFRVVEEALTNVVRHAKARRVHLGVQELPDALQLRVADDGIGIQQERLTEATSFGLTTIRYGTQQLGGACEWREAPTGGTELQIRLPLERLLVPNARAG